LNTHRDSVFSLPVGFFDLLVDKLVTVRGARREDPDADLKKKRFIYKNTKQKHKARTKSAAEPDYQKLNCEKITKQD